MKLSRFATIVATFVIVLSLGPPAFADSENVPAGFAPASTSWTGPDTGYVLGYTRCGTTWCPALLATTDGARHWRRLTPPPISLPDNHNHVALTVVDDRVAYVSDGTRVLTTRDGARHWRPIELVAAPEPRYISKIAETGGRVFAVVTTFGEGAGSTRLYTAKAGAPVLVPEPGFAVSGGLTYGDLAVGGGVQVALGADYGLEKYWISRDGARFTPASPPCPEGTVASLADVRVQRVVALCSGSAGSPQPGSMERQLWRAPHLGAAFTGTSAAPAAGIHQGFAAATAEVATVAAEGGDTAFLHSTFDGGRTWTTTVLGQDRFGITDLAFPAGGTGVVIFGQPDAAGGSALYRTTDGGRSWPEVRFG